MADVITSPSTTYLANLDVFSGTLQELAATNRNLLVVTSDSRGSGKLVPFAQKFPKQLIEI
ncbi:MAG: transketolase family protein, partial [Cytophagaceae bacterium]